MPHELKRYALRVMMPGSDGEVAGDFYSDTPFGAIAVGDVLDLGAARREPGAGKFRVTRVEHKLVSVGETGHHLIALYTEAVK
jgi:hypothetical protein